MIELTREKIQDCLVEVTAYNEMTHITAFSAESWLIHFYYDKSVCGGDAMLSAYYGYRGFDFKIKIHIPTHREIDVDNIKAKVEAIRGELKTMLDGEAENDIK